MSCLTASCLVVELKAHASCASKLWRVAEENMAEFGGFIVGRMSIYNQQGWSTSYKIMIMQTCKFPRIIWRELSGIVGEVVLNIWLENKLFAK